MMRWQNGKNTIIHALFLFNQRNLPEKRILMLLRDMKVYANEMIKRNSEKKKLFQLI